MNIASIFRRALAEFIHIADELGPIQRAVYVATSCGGVSELALYSMVGGCFRNLLEAECSDYRLLVDSRSQGVKKRPDFQVHHKSSPKTPLFAAEFKILSDTGAGRGHYGQVLPTINEDLGKLVAMRTANPDLETGAVVFFLRDGKRSAKIIDQRLAALGFRCEGVVPLWRPKGISYTTILEIHLANNAKAPADDPVQGG